MPRETWAIVLAAGDGTRLRSVTTDACGACTPKQFLGFGQPMSLLRRTLERARALAGSGRVVTVVAAGHERWWRRERALAGFGRTVVQPRNAGTAAGLLLPLMSILAEDPDAVVVVMPSDHHVADEALFAATLRRLAEAACADTTKVVLLGMEPDCPETQYGWIVPSSWSDGVTHGVDAFVEKPRSEEAAALLQRGALWSTFVIGASAVALKDLFQRAAPDLACRFVREAAYDPRFATDVERLSALYDELDTADFSAAVLQHPACRGLLRMLPAPACGWTDLGTPERLAATFPDAPELDASRRPALPPGVRRPWRGIAR